MGAVIGIFKRAKSTTELLEHINKEIESRQNLHQRNLHLQKKYAISLVAYSVFAYIAAWVFVVAYYFPTLRWSHRVLCVIPLLLFPPVIWLLKKLLHWYFVRHIADNDAALQELKEKKKIILEEVMEKETYKKAREILEKYDPEKFKTLEKASDVSATVAATPRLPQTGMDLRRRQTGGEHQQGLPGSPQVVSTPASVLRPTTAYVQGMPPPHLQGQPGLLPHARLPLPRYVPPRERSAVDRLVEYLVGDGPNNRYALICNQCCSHNGMALKEEFEYLSFRCCYCFCLNPAKRERPNAPSLETQREQLLRGVLDYNEADDDDDDANTVSDSGHEEPAPQASGEGTVRGEGVVSGEGEVVRENAPFNVDSGKPVSSNSRDTDGDIVTERR